MQFLCAAVSYYARLGIRVRRLLTDNGSANLNFALTNPTFTAFIADDLSIGRETGAANFVTPAANGSLTLASNSALTLGSATTPATLNIGWSQNTNSSSSGSATGVLDALDRAAVLNLNLSELNVGRGSYTGVGTGTLRWNQSEVITAPNVYFGRGNATGILDVPAGGEFHLGTASAPITNLRIAYNDAGNGTATANLNFALTNPTFTAFIADDLSIGRETGAANFVTPAANGSLTLASNSALTLGSATTPATLNIGWSQNTNSSSSGSATGVLDASAGTLTAELTTLNVGVTALFGSSNGQLILGNGTTLDANIVNIGVGPNATGTIDFADNFTGSFSATTVNFNNGLFDFGTNTLEIGGTASIAAQTFNMGGGVLTGNAFDINAGGIFNFGGTFNGTLNQNGGTLAPGGATIAPATVNGNYNLAAAGTLQIQVSTGATSDQLSVNGSVDLNGTGATGGTLDVALVAAPQLNASFTFLLNDGADAILGEFAGLADGSTFTETFGANVFTFEIDYQGGDGNDVELTVVNVAPLTLGTGIGSDSDFGPDAFVDPASALPLIGLLPADPALHPLAG